MKQVALGLLIASAAMAAPADLCPCNSGNYLKVVDTADRTKDVCEPNPTGTDAKENCNAYTHDGTTLTCVGCSDGFYLKSAACVANPKSGDAEYVEGCASYLSTGVCAGCADKWLDSTASPKVCKDPTTAVTDCAIYSDATTCAGCKSEKLLDANECKAKAPTTAVAGCSRYTVSGTTYTCVACEADKYLDAGECKTDITAVENCMYYSSKTACSTCKDGFHLDGTACKTCPDKGKKAGGDSSASILSMSAAVLAFLLLLA